MHGQEQSQVRDVVSESRVLVVRIVLQTSTRRLAASAKFQVVEVIAYHFAPWNPSRRQKVGICVVLWM